MGRWLLPGSPLIIGLFSQYTYNIQKADILATASVCSHSHVKKQQRDTSSVGVHWQLFRFNERLLNELGKTKGTMTSIK